MTCAGPYAVLADTPVVVVTEPAIEPVSLADAKVQLRIDAANTTEDTLIRSLIRSARRFLEKATRRALITQTLDAYPWAFPSDREALRLPQAPLVSVTSVTTYDADNVAAVMAASGYIVDTAHEPGRIALNASANWPTDLRAHNPIVVRYVAGYGATESFVPEDLRHAMKLLVAHWFENREGALVTPGSNAVPLPYGVEQVVGLYQVVA